MINIEQEKPLYSAKMVAPAGPDHLFPGKWPGRFFRDEKLSIHE
jgi:hypothetical protein